VKVEAKRKIRAGKWTTNLRSTTSAFTAREKNSPRSAQRPRSKKAQWTSLISVVRASLWFGAILLSAALLCARERNSPPSVPPPEPIALPLPTVRALPNGLQVLVVERHSLPVLTLRMNITAGPEADPPNLPGTAQFAASMYNEGTTHHSALDLAEAIDGAGGTFDNNSEWDISSATLTVLSDHAPLAFDLMADMTLHPAYAPADVERIRKQTVSAIEVLHEDPAYLADAVTDQLILAGTPYGHPGDGTLDATRNLTSQDLAAFHAAAYLPGHSVLAVVGDITPAEAFQLAERYFAGWAGPPSASAAAHSAPSWPVRTSAAGTTRIVIVDKPDAVQTEIRVGFPGIPHSSPDYVALTVANQILGGPASNRLFSDLRGEHGLTYSASSDIDCYVTTGVWVAKTSTRNAETAKAVQRVLEEMKHMREHAISAGELQQAADYLIGHQALDFETSAGIADQFLDLMTYHLPLDTWSTLPAALRKLTPDDVWQATRRYLDPDQATIVLVGNASVFERDMRMLGATRVIPIDALDLASPGLERTGGGSGAR
jgi:zinc protease